MPKRRDQIRMTDSEVWSFIEQQKSMQVCTLNRDGSPHLTTLWFAVVDGELVFETFTKSQKVKNLQRDPRIAVLFEDGTEYAKLRGVTVNATARLYSDPGDVERLAGAVMLRNTPGLTPEQLGPVAQRMAAKRSAIVVPLEKVVSWDHTKLEVDY